LLCNWHAQRNIVSKFASLSSLDKNLYQKVINIPFIRNKSKFDNLIEEVEESDDVTDDQYNYLLCKLQRKQCWAKCYIKINFTGDISITSHRRTP